MTVGSRGMFVGELAMFMSRGRVLLRVVVLAESRPACPSAWLQTSGNRAWRARQGDPAQAANDGKGLADNRPGWPSALPQPEARRASGSGMARPHAQRHGNGRRGRVCRDELSVADQDRQKGHRSTLVGSALLWAISGRCGASEQRGARWVNRTRRRDAPPKSDAVRFTPENRRRRAWSRPSTRSTPSGKPAPPSFSRKSTRAGRCCRRFMMMAGFPAARWSGALKRLIADIEAGQIDVVVVYKVDRLTRALSDFAKLVEVFDRRGVSFVSITQQFNTTTSMGRLTLNVLLSFAQFEREVTGERI